MNLFTLSPSRTGAESRWRGVSYRITAWMAVGLVVAGAASAIASSAPSIVLLARRQGYVFVFLLLLLLGAAITLSALIVRLPTWLAVTAFLTYSALNGLALTGLALTATGASPIVAFLVTAGGFAALSMYGRMSGRDFTHIEGLILFGALAVSVVSLVHILLQSPMAAWIFSYMGVGLCVGLAAMDAREMKQMAVRADELRMGRLAILGALVLYLDLLLVFAKLLIGVLQFYMSYTSDHESKVPSETLYPFR